VHALWKLWTDMKINYLAPIKIVVMSFTKKLSLFKLYRDLMAALSSGSA